MPKIIENVRGLLINEAKAQIDENGYENVTIRSIARGCGIGLGTFYNYFKSKDMLIATFLLEDWQEMITNVTEKTKGESDPVVVVKEIYVSLGDFIKKHYSIFAAPEAKKAFNNTVGVYHKVLRLQISQPIHAACVLGGYENPEFLSQFVAESTLTWAVAKKDYDEFAAVIEKLFIK